MRIGIIGDSQSEGLASSLIPLLEAKGLEVVDTMLVRGMSLSSMRASPSLTAQARRVAARSPDALVVILGGNNRKNTAQDYGILLRWFLEEVASSPRAIWWIGPAASTNALWGPRHARTRELQKQLLSRASRVQWIDAWPMTRSGVAFAPDGLHFTAAGYRVWSRRLAAALPPGTPLGLLLGAGLLGVAGGIFLATVRR